MKVFAKTDVGKARDMNEDFYYVSDNEEPKLYILADGMGGYNGGEIASKLATNSVKSYIETNFSQISHDKESILKLIESAIEYANMVVYEKAKMTERSRKYGYYFRGLLNI
jgi:protein phosphatase